MNLNIKKLALFSLFVCTSLFIGCKDDDADPIEEINFSAENTALVARADNIMEGAQNIVESGYGRVEEPNRLVNTFFPECTTFILNGGGSNGGSIIIDFGQNCQLFNGATVSGKVNIDYGALVAGTRNITYSYEDFTYNGNTVIGGGDITRVIENQNGNPQSTVNEQITVGFTGTSITGTRSGLRVAEWTEGVGSGSWTDNVYRINGNWETNLSNGFERTGVVTQTLVRKLSCLYFVSGKIEVTQESLTGVIDYGNGTCDNIATITFLGQDFPVVLGN